MHRDSDTQSIWQNDLPGKTPAPTINTDDLFDVLIVGAGITGLTTALLLQQAGQQCLVVEAKNIGFGTSSATTAHLNTLLDTHYYDIMKKFGLLEAELMARGAKQAMDIVQRNVEQYRIECHFKRLDAVLFSETKEQSEYLEHIRKSMEEVDIASSYTDHIPVPIPFDRALVVPDQAQFQPVDYLNGIAGAFLAAGGKIMENEPIHKDAIEDFDHYALLTADSRKIKVKNVVYATHIPPGINLLHFECAAYRSYVLAVQLEGNDYPDSLVYDMRVPYNYFRTAYMNGTKYLLVGGLDHKTGHQQDAEKQFAALERYVKQYYRLRSIDYKWSSQYYEPADGLPYVGRLPGASDTTYTATGFSGSGITLGTLSARIPCDLITTGKSEFKDLLSPSRIRPVAGFENFVKENADVINRFVADRLSVDKIKELAELPADAGVVANYHGENYALYKDLNQKITALSPVCPHAKCLVQWNNAEKSWDCPCHGSRFNRQGAVLNGPATTPLRKVTLTTS